MNDLAEYQKWVAETAKYKRGLIYTVATTAAESGEMLNDLVKVMRGDPDSASIDAATILPSTRDKLLSETSDVLWGIAATLNELGSSFEELAAINRQKVEERISSGNHFRKL